MAVLTIDRKATFQSYDYTTYKTETPLENQIVPLTGILTGQTNVVNVIGDGSKTIAALRLQEPLEIITSNNIDLEDLRITGNRIKIFNSGTAVITIQTGITGSLTYENLNKKSNVEAFFDGTYWRVVDGLAIGSIQAWHKDFNSETPALPWGWIACDGSTISDAESIYNGATVQDLNGDARFLRAGNTSGTEQDDQANSIDYMNSAQAPGTTTGTQQIPDDGTYSGVIETGDTGAVSIAFKMKKKNVETRPINMSVVLIIKIK